MRNEDGGKKGGIDSRAERPPQATKTTNIECSSLDSSYACMCNSSGHAWHGTAAALSISQGNVSYAEWFAFTLVAAQAAVMTARSLGEYSWTFQSTMAVVNHPCSPPHCSTPCAAAL